MTSDTAREEPALDALLRAAIEHDRAKPPAVPELHWHGEIKATPFTWRDPTTLPNRAERQLMALLDDPVGAALRQAVRRVGEHLFVKLGSISAMSELADRVAAMDPAREGYRAAIMDHAWDGVGAGEDRWWC